MNHEIIISTLSFSSLKYNAISLSHYSQGPSVSISNHLKRLSMLNNCSLYVYKFTVEEALLITLKYQNI